MLGDKLRDYVDVGEGNFGNAGNFCHDLGTLEAFFFVVVRHEEDPALRQLVRGVCIVQF